MSRFLSILISCLAFGNASTAFAAEPPTRDASIKQLFTKVNNTSKGALDKNVYQLPNGRSLVAQDSTVTGPPDHTIFVVAYRNEVARQLAALGFYVGNHFTSNYYELHNEFLATDAERKALAFRMDHARFLATSEVAPKAQLMSKHMLLESFYMQKFPNTRLTRGMLQRGTADTEYEKVFYQRMNEELAKNLGTTGDYVTLYEIARRFHLSGDPTDASLQKIRDLVASVYDAMAMSLPESEALAQFYSIRNSIHNYMTPDVVARLNAYISTYESAVFESEMSRIKRLRDLVVAYYRVDKKIILQSAKALGARLPAGTVDVINALADRGNAPDRLEQLSWAMAKVLDAFRASRDAALVDWLVDANRFLSTELASHPFRQGDSWPVRARIALDGAYVAGLVTAADWSASRTVLTEVNAADGESVRKAHQEMVRIIGAASTLARAGFSPAVDDWAKLERVMDGIVDDTLRASLLLELNQVATTVKATLPAVKTKYSVEVEGEAVGYLTYLPKGSPEAAVAKLDRTQIVIFADLPLDLGVVAGIVTEQPQTPLSHVSIKSRARGTANVYFPNASQDPMFKDLLAKRALVRMTVRGGQLSVREASLDEAKEFWARMSAPVKVVVRSDLSERRLRSTKELGSGDVLTVGAKVANYGEAQKAVGEQVILEALSVPFFYYKQFMDSNTYDGKITLSARVAEMVADSRMKTDREYRVEQLKALQKRMTSLEMVVNADLVRDLQAKIDAIHPGHKMKFRSSTNSEDLADFSGAGLYDSYAYEPGKPKKSIPETLKKTWASVWNLRAYDERELFGIEHSQVYMAILVSPAFSSEEANGVAVTRNTVHPDMGPGFYINAQKGEEAVTNPDPAVTPEEWLVLLKADAATKRPYTLKYLKASSLSANQPVLSQEETVRLADLLSAIHKRFKKHFDPSDKNKKFAIDVEWKVDLVNGARQIFIKQARPYVD